MPQRPRPSRPNRYRTDAALPHGTVRDRARHEIRMGRTTGRRRHLQRYWLSPCSGSRKHRSATLQLAGATNRERPNSRRVAQYLGWVALSAGLAISAMRRTGRLDAPSIPVRLGLAGEPAAAVVTGAGEQNAHRRTTGGGLMKRKPMRKNGGALLAGV